MSNETNKALAYRFYEQVLNGRQVHIIDEIAAAGYDEHDPLPGQGEGREGLKNRVNSGRHVGDFLGIAPTDRPYAIAGIDIYRIEDGRLAEHWHVVDQLSMLQQLGLMPTPDGAAA